MESGRHGSPQMNEYPEREKTPTAFWRIQASLEIISPACRQDKLAGHMEGGARSHGRASQVTGEKVYTEQLTGERSSHRRTTHRGENSSQGKEAYMGEQLTGERS